MAGRAGLRLVYLRHPRPLFVARLAGANHSSISKGRAVSPRMERRPAFNAAHLAINGLGTGFSTNELIARVTVGAIETYGAAWHGEAYGSYVAEMKKPRRRLTGDAGAPIAPTPFRGCRRHDLGGKSLFAGYDRRRAGRLQVA